MRSTLMIAALGLSLLPLPLFAQSMPQTAAVDSAAAPARAASSPASVASGADGITREEYMKRAQERAGERAAARFDQLDTNHDGVLDRAEIRAWRSQHARHAAAPPSRPAPQ